MVFEYVLAQKGIDKKDVNINQSIDFGSTAAAFSGGQGDYTIEFEPSATLLEQKGDGYVVGIGRNGIRVCAVYVVQRQNRVI